MFKCKADYTITFRELSEISLEDLESAKYPKVVQLAMYATYIHSYHRHFGHFLTCLRMVTIHGQCGSGHMLTDCKGTLNITMLYTVIL